jgi:glycosyltransferase involved in cell wall biosynthesis
MRSGRAVILSDYVGGEGAASGGAGHAALDSYRALRDAGAEVRVVAGFGRPDAIEPARLASLGGGDLRAGGRAAALKTIYNSAAADALTTELASEDPDTTLVIVHQWTRYLTPAALRVVQRFPTMVYMHDYFWACPNGIYYDFQEERPCDRRPMGVRCVTANCDRQGRVEKLGRIARQATRMAVAPRRGSRRLFLHLSEQAHRTAAPLLPGERHAILYNPLTLPERLPAAPTPRFDVGYFGRLEADKGVPMLADAVAALGLTGLFVGQGSCEPMLAATPGIEHRAWQPRDSMAAAMRDCGLVVLPSRWHETWGLIVPEAMAAGVPVLVSALAGSAELVRRFGGGATFDPGVPGDLETKLAAVRPSAITPERYDAMRAFLSPERHAARIMNLARSQFGLDLVAAPVRPRAVRPVSRPALLQPQPR